MKLAGVPPSPIFYRIRNRFILLRLDYMVCNRFIPLPLDGIICNRFIPLGLGPKLLDLGAESQDPSLLLIDSVVVTSRSLIQK